MAGFLDTIRQPKRLQEWADIGKLRAGESDPYARAWDFKERQFREQQRGGGNYSMPSLRGGGGISRVGNGLMGQMNPTGTINQPMDVVYDQRPEMEQKRLNLAKDRMNLEQKNLEAERATEALKANDAYIDNRRDNALDQRKFETADWAARNMKPGEMGDREKLDAEAAFRHADTTQKGINAWIAAREAAQGKREAAQETANARRDVADTTAAMRNDLANTPDNRMKDLQYRLAEMGIKHPEYQGALKYDDKGGVQIDPEADEQVRRQVAAYLYGDANVAKMNGMSSNVGGQPNSAGLRGNAPIDQNATANPYAANANNQAATGTKQVMRKRQRNAKTGETRELMSLDGGVTWQPSR